MSAIRGPRGELVIARISGELSQPSAIWCHDPDVIIAGGGTEECDQAIIAWEGGVGRGGQLGHDGQLSGEDQCDQPYGTLHSGTAVRSTEAGACLRFWLG